MASFIDQGGNFSGSEVVLIDLDAERLAVVKKIAEKMACATGLDLTVTTTTDRKSGLADCDAVLTSYRPGGFESRYIDESIPLKYGIIGQETQGPGGFFMALRSIAIMQGIVRDIETICPNAKIFNYTNPVNIVSQAVVNHSDISIVSLCEGPIIFPRHLATIAGLDPDAVDALLVGINHNCWSVRHLYLGQDMMPFLRAAYQEKQRDPSVKEQDLRLLRLAVSMDSLPSSYFQYYYYHDEILEELRAKGTTRSQDIMKSLPDYWTHYREQAELESPELDPSRSRGGIHELELAIDVMDAQFNDRKEVWPVNVPNRGALSGFPDDVVVEVPGYVDKSGISPLVVGAMPSQVVGLVKALSEYQVLAANAAWNGTRIDGIRALASHPWVHSLAKAERMYDEMASHLKKYLPERLLK